MKLDTKNLTITLSFNTLIKLLTNAELFKELIDNDQLNKEALKSLLSTIDRHYELRNLIKNTTLLDHIIKNGLFQELIDKFKSINDDLGNLSSYNLLENKELFKDLIKKKLLNTEDTRYLLNRIDKILELERVCRNTPLIKHILNEFILNREDVDRFNAILENNWYNLHTLFDLVEYQNKNKEILKLNELNKYVYSFDLTEDQRLELAVLIVDNEQAQNTLIQIVDSNLEDQYDFDELKNLLTKDNKKKKIKLNL